MMAGKYSNEQGAIQALITGAPIDKDMVTSFDPPSTLNLDGKIISLKKTEAYPVIPAFGAAATVAVFGERGPALDQDNTENQVHRDCDVGVLVRRPDLEHPSEYIEAIRATEQVGLKPKTAWIVELLIPDDSGGFKQSGHVRAYAPTGA